MLFDFFSIQKRTFRGIRFFLARVLQTVLFTFRFQLSLQLPERNAHKILIVSFPQLNLLLDSFQATDHNGSESFFDTSQHYILDGSVEKVIQFVLSFSVYLSHPFGRILEALFVVDCLPFRDLLVVPLVDAFDFTSIDDVGRARGTFKAGHQIVQAQIDTQTMFLFDLGHFGLLSIHEFHIELLPSETWLESDLAESLDVQQLFWDGYLECFCLGFVLLFESARKANQSKAIAQADALTSDLDGCQSLLGFVTR